MPIDPPLEHQLIIARTKIKSLEEINATLGDLLKDALSIIQNGNKNYWEEMEFAKKVEEIIK